MTYIKIATTSFSAASTVNVDNVFSAAYTHYLVVRNLSGPPAAFAALAVRLRVSGTDASGTDYRKQYVLADSTTVSGARATAATSWADALGYTEATSMGLSVTRISNPFDVARTTAWTDYGYNHTTTILLTRSVYAHDLSTSYTGFSITPSTGTITGSVTVYGLKES